MEKRLASSEFDALKHFAAAVSELNYMKEDLKTLWDSIDGGKEKIEKCSKEASTLFNDILNIISVQQLKTLKNAMTDYKFMLVPKIAPGSNSIVMDKDYAKQLINLAQAECKICVNTPEEAEACPIYSTSIGVIPPSTYDTLICPYSQSEWAD